MDRKGFAVAWLIVGILPTFVQACLWDYDTLKAERMRFPSTLELITGKFLRHSKEFYQWRIQDRLKKLRTDSNHLAYYDDMAVAYDKIGDHRKAIETIRIKDRKHPGLYETEANLGTFLIHDGQLEDGLKHIERAIQINPNAHFGREKYQKALVEYLLARRKAGHQSLPLLDIPALKGAPDGPEDPEEFLKIKNDFPSFLWAGRTNSWKYPDLSQRQEALTGIQGMMKFGNYNSPVLLEALGSILSRPNDDPNQDAKRLAARAYLKAAYESSDEQAKTDYRRLARAVLNMQTIASGTTETLSLEDLEKGFQQELTEANEWYAQLRDQELRWIREGKNPEQQFDALYDREPRIVALTDDSLKPRRLSFAAQAALILGVSLTICTVLVALLISWIRRLRRKRALSVGA